jgi:fatty acid CoA ligase FadD9
MRAQPTRADSAPSSAPIIALPLLHNYQRPEKPACGSVVPAGRFRSAVQEAKIGPDKDIPHVSAPIIVKYITNLQLLGLL